MSLASFSVHLKPRMGTGVNFLAWWKHSISWLVCAYTCNNPASYELRNEPKGDERKVFPFLLHPVHVSPSMATPQGKGKPGGKDEDSASLFAKKRTKRKNPSSWVQMKFYSRRQLGRPYTIHLSCRASVTLSSFHPDFSAHWQRLRRHCVAF